MPVHRPSQTIFYHIPKCAGSALEEQFEMRAIQNLFLPEFDTVRHNGVRFSLQHLTPSAVSSLYPEFASFDSFALTRHPYAKCISAYFWIRTRLDRRRIFRFSERSFQRWCLEFAALHDIDHTLHQYHWTEETDVVLDISETEKLIQIFADRMPQNKGPLQHSKKNPFDTKKIVNGLSQQSLDIVYKLYEKDFDLLKYKRSLER